METERDQNAQDIDAICRYKPSLLQEFNASADVSSNEVNVFDLVQYPTRQHA